MSSDSPSIDEQRTSQPRGGDRLLSVRDLETVFNTEKGRVQAVDGVSFEMEKGQVLGLVGESGAGKSVTARSVLRLIESPGRIVDGAVDFFGTDVLSMGPETLREYRAENTGIVFQDPTSTLNPTMRVGEQVTEAVESAGTATGAAAKKETIRLLDRVGIPNASERAEDYPHEFSGGQKQRIAIAIAIAGQPDLLIADEPTTALDVTIQAQILELLHDLREDLGMGILFITHDLGVVREICDRVAVMYAGSIVEVGEVESVFTGPRHPYTKGLLASIPGLDREGSVRSGDRLDVIEGTMPDLTESFEGCKYADRCPGANDECRTAHPPLEELPGIDGDRSVACYYHDEVDQMEYEYVHRASSLSWKSAVAAKGDDETVLAVQGLEKHFSTGGLLDRLGGDPEPVRAVDGIDFSIDAGETIGLVGESGCGKSTAARSILRLIEPTDGVVWYRGQDVTEASAADLRSLRRNLQIVFQDAQSSLNPRRTVRRILMRPMELHGIGSSDEDRQDRVEELIEAVGLDLTHLDRYPNELSGGQLQRVGVARALAVNPEVIILDEPVSGLDVSVQAKILNLLADLQDELGVVYIVISHNLSIVKHISDHIAVMYLGEIAEYGEVDEVFHPPYHPYTEAHLSSVPGTESATLSDADRIVLEGDVPDPSAIPTGCRFHPRCPRKIGEVCEVEVPEQHMDGTHQIGCHLMRDEYAEEVTWVDRDTP